MWIDRKKSLVLDRNRDTWQLPLINFAGEYLGHVVAQVVEPHACMVRYFLIYDPSHNRRFLLPSDTVTSIDDQVCCDIKYQQVALLPEYKEVIEREDEVQIYQIVDRTPYWEQASDI